MKISNFLFPSSLFALLYICQFSIVWANLETVTKTYNEYKTKLETNCKDCINKVKKNKLKIALSIGLPICALELYGAYLFHEDKKKHINHTVGKIILLSWLRGFTQTCEHISSISWDFSQYSKQLLKKLDQKLIPYFGQASHQLVEGGTELDTITPGLNLRSQSVYQGI